MDDRTCGQCAFFRKNPVGAYGICEKREFLIDRKGGYIDRKFIPYQGRRACKDDFQAQEKEKNRRLTDGSE